MDLEKAMDECSTQDNGVDEGFELRGKMLPQAGHMART